MTYFGSPYRAKAHEVISRVLEEHRGKPIAELRKLVSAAYPFGQRNYWPYKIWCDEVKKLLGTKTTPAQKGAYQKLREWEELYGKRSEEGSAQTSCGERGEDLPRS